MDSDTILFQIHFRTSTFSKLWIQSWISTSNKAAALQLNLRRTACILIALFIATRKQSCTRCAARPPALCRGSPVLPPGKGTTAADRPQPHARPALMRRRLVAMATCASRHNHRIFDNTVASYGWESSAGHCVNMFSHLIRWYSDQLFAGIGHSINLAVICIIPGFRFPYIAV